MRKPVVAGLLLLLLAVQARAQDVVSDLEKRLGKTVDLSADPTLKKELVANGLVNRDATSIDVTPQLVTTAIGVQRFRNHVDVVRYHVGDRILVEQPGSGGKYSPRAEIKGINADGTYDVEVWGKPQVDNPRPVWGHVDVFTGLPQGVSKPSATDTPWLTRNDAHEVVMTQAEIDALNGKVAPTAPYKVNGWTIDPANDPVLKDRLDKAWRTVEKLFPADVLALPQDLEARTKKLEEIARLQEKALGEIFADNFIEHPGNNPRANDRMRQTLADHPDLAGKIGAVLDSACGVCTDQAAAMVSILDDVGARMGLTARAIGGATIRENAGHGFVALRFANGKLGMYDVTWHFQGDKTPVDSMDYATWEGVQGSNRKIDWISQQTTDETPFVDRARAQDLYRGYTAPEGETLLAAQAAQLAATKGIPLGEAAEKVFSRNTGPEKIAGDFSLAELTNRAGSLGTIPPASSPGLLSRLGGLLSDRVQGAAEGPGAEDR
ncbi:MAG TPA: hypothetical protein VFF73_17080 [Planctomycetota bacterium]|nr:hypothetical protein [Planctomycetota bacterium]